MMDAVGVALSAFQQALSKSDAVLVEKMKLVEQVHIKLEAVCQEVAKEADALVAAPVVAATQAKPLVVPSKVTTAPVSMDEDE